MATKNTARTAARALTTLAQSDIATLKAERDALYHGMPNDSTRKAKRQAMMAENGVHAAARAKGYGRASAAKALGISPAEYWVWEFVLPVGTTNHATALAAVQALPALTKPKADSTKETSKPKPAPAPKPVQAAEVL